MVTSKTGQRECSDYNRDAIFVINDNTIQLLVLFMQHLKSSHITMFILQIYICPSIELRIKKGVNWEGRERMRELHE